jgi:hypothetical protein
MSMTADGFRDFTAELARQNNVSLDVAGEWASKLGDTFTPLPGGWITDYGHTVKVKYVHEQPNRKPSPNRRKMTFG